MYVLSLTVPPMIAPMYILLVIVLSVIVLPVIVLPVFVLPVIVLPVIVLSVFVLPVIVCSVIVHQSCETSSVHNETPFAYAMHIFSVCMYSTVLDIVPRLPYLSPHATSTYIHMCTRLLYFVLSQT